MLIDIRIQKNGTVVLRAPDDSVYTFDVKTSDPENASEVCRAVGEQILQILGDPEQPAAKIIPAGHPRAGSLGSGEGVEGPLRNFLGAVLGDIGTGALDALQNASYGGDSEASD
jgi:hypothetical protein